MNKNIWIINQYAGSPIYGMNYRSYYIAQEFRKKGFNVTIFSGSYSHLFHTYPKVTGLFTQENHHGINYVWVKLRKYKSSKSVGRLLSMFEFMLKLNLFKYKSLPKPNKIIISSLSILPVITAIKFSRKLKIDYIFEIRDIWPLTLIEVGGFSKYNPLVLYLGFLEKLGYKKASHVVSVLPNADKHMVTKGMAQCKFRYIPNGILLDELANPEPLSSAELHLIPKDKFIVGYTGTIGIANALDYFFEAAIALRDENKIHFVLVGNGGEIESFKKLIQKNDLKNITFIPAINKIKIQSMLSNFDLCFIGANKHPIYRFGVSANKIFDYMYSGKPVIYAIESSNDPIKESGCGISIKAADSKEIKNAILKIKNLSKEERELMGNRGKEYVIKYHSYSNLIDKYIKII